MLEELSFVLCNVMLCCIVLHDIPMVIVADVIAILSNVYAWVS
jgi:hypothetical protein